MSVLSVDLGVSLHVKLDRKPHLTERTLKRFLFVRSFVDN